MTTLIDEYDADMPDKTHRANRYIVPCRGRAGRKTTNLSVPVLTAQLDTEVPLSECDQAALCHSEPPPHVQDKLQARIDAMRKLKYGYAQNTCE